MSPSPDFASIEHEIAAGWDLFGEGREDDVAHVRWLAERFPDDPRAHSELGGSLDAARREAEAVPDTAGLSR